MKIMLKLIFTLIPALLVLVSCSVRINGSLQANGQAQLQISAALEPRMTGLLGRLSEASGAPGNNASFLNGQEISMSLANAPGIDSAELKNISDNAIEGPVKISRINDLLAYGMEETGTKAFIDFAQNAGTGRFNINLNMNTGPYLLALISPDVKDYLAALMAPLATGEKMTRTEYLDLVRSVYGRGISDEIAASRIRVSIDFPGQITGVTGGTFSGRKADFDIPLTDVLVLEKPLSYEVEWK